MLLKKSKTSRPPTLLVAKTGQILVTLPKPIRRMALWADKHRLATRFASILMVIVILFSVASVFFESQLKKLQLRLSPKAEALIIGESKLYGEYLQYDAESDTYTYNNNYDGRGDGIKGPSGGPKFSSIFFNDTAKGVKIIDPVNSVDFTIKPKFTLIKPEKSRNRLFYKLPGRSATKIITLGASGYKEDVLLEKYAVDNFVLDYQLDLPSTLEARLESGSLYIYGVDNQALLGNVATATDDDAALLEKARQNAPKNKLLFSLPAPYINESDKSTPTLNAHFELEGDTLKVVAENLKNLNYPISIDPSIYIESARKLMRGNNETNIDFDVGNELIQKSQTTGARINDWTDTTNMNGAFWGNSVAAAGGYVYAAGGNESTTNSVPFSSGSHSFNVPSGVTSIIVKAWGAGGGGGGGGSNVSGFGGAGGGGAFAQATLSVTPGESLSVYVGSAGGLGSGSTPSGNSGDGGGGGGHSEVNRSGTNLIVASGGGGGGGGDNSSGTDGGNGGAGGTTNGSAGGNSGSAGGGGGASTSTGGTAGTGGATNGTAGGSETAGDGGNGTNAASTTGGANNGGQADDGDGGDGDLVAGFAGGGGGGGGLFGGGGGSASASGNAGGGGGGGGSSIVTGTSTSLLAGSGATPGNSGDADRNSAGEGGTGGLRYSDGTNGTDGRVVIIYLSGASQNQKLYWAEFNDTTGAVDSPNPGDGVCSGWCGDDDYDLPDVRIGASMVAYNGFLYLIGGTDESGTRQSTVYIAKLGASGEPSLWHPTDTNKNNWVYWYASTNSLPSATSYLAAIAYNNRLYVTGGQTNASPGGVTTVQFADLGPTGDISGWSTTGMQALPSGAGNHMHSVQVYNDVLYAIGGFEGAQTSSANLRNTVYYSRLNNDGTMNAWVQTKSFSTARATFGGSFSTIWGAYIYLSGGCTAVNGSGYCTTVASDTQIISINADGSLDEWDPISGLTNQRLGYTLLGWQNGLYRFSGCETINGSTGDCTSILLDVDYGVINPAGEVSTVDITEPSGTSPCNGGTPYNCDLPPPGDDAGEGGQLLTMSTILNGYLYVIGGCIDYDCNGTNPAGDDADVTGNISYVSIDPNGHMTAPASCSGTSYGAWCVDSTNRINGTTGVAAGGITTFNGRIYIVGGLNGSGNVTNIYYNSVNSDGSLAGAWSTVDMTTAGIAEDISYTYAYARANPASAGTNPGNLFVFGGCGTNTGGAGCGGNDYETEVYKCNITTSGSVSGCTTSGQLQIDSTPGTGGVDGLGIHSGTVYANYIFLVGGYSQAEADKDDVIYARFDNSNNVVAVTGSDWIESANKLSVGRRRGWAFGYNGHIYSVGGYDDSGTGIIPFIEWSKMNVSDGSIDPFVTSSVTINQRWGLSMVVSNSFAYVIGGCDTGASPSGCSSFEPSVQIFQLYNNDSGAADSYSAGANLFGTDRLGSSSAVVNGYMYVAGGCISSTDCTDATSSVQYAALDAYGNLGSWSSTTASLPADRAWGQLEVAGGSLYYIGGQSDTVTDERAEVYYATPSSGDITTWSTASNGLPAARTQHSAAVWNGRIYVTGGNNTGGTATNTIYVSPQLSAGGNITSAWTSDTDTFNVARSGTTAITYANNLYILGGYDGSNYLNDVQFTQINSDGSLDPWTFTTSLPQAIRQGDGYAANGYIYLVGGRSTDTTCDSNTFLAPISANTTIATGNNPTGVGEWYETNQKYAGNRYGNSISYYNGKMYVLGGGCSASSPVTRITDDFDATIDGSQWTSTGSTVADTSCSSVSGNSLRFNGSNATRIAATIDTDVSSGGYIEFYVYAPASGGGSCETPDAGENMALEYSTNSGGSWTTINTYTPTQDPITFYSVPIPVGAQTGSTRFRWRQTANSGTTFDHWAIDDVLITENGTPTLTLTGANRVQQATLNSQPQVAKYSRMIDTDTDVFPNGWLLNGLDNSIGARWRVRYRSSTASNSTWGQDTNYGDTTLGDVASFTPLDSSGTNTNFARYFYFFISIDASQTFGYPEDVNRGPTITDLSLFFTSDPGKRLRHGKTFTGGELQPLDTPCGQSEDADCPNP